VSLRIVFTPNAWQDYDGWLRRDTKMARRISKLIIDVQRDP
jgi:toxin YoeB